LKKIAIIAFGNDYSGGVYQYTQSVIDALKEDKKNIYIIFCNADDNRFKDYGLEIRIIDKPVSSVLEKIIRAFQQLFFIRKTFFFKKNEIDKYSDIDIFFSPGAFAYPHFYLNKPFIFTLHDMQERYFPEFFSIFERINRWLNNRALAKKSSLIVCESNFVKNDIVKFIRIDKNKIKIVQSPPPEIFLNYKFEKIKFEQIKKKYNLPSKYIFYPAQCWFHKNHIKLVEAFKLVTNDFDDVHLLLVGSQLNNYKNLINRINQLELNEKVKHLGYIDYEDLAYLYKMSQMLVMPTLFESISIPIYEAFALNVPVCSSDVVALPEQIGNAGIIFNAHDINDMAEKIMMYLSDESLRVEKAKKGFDKVSHFNHDGYSKKLQEVLNDLAL
jgi:glycosyltransferase involved in cell wall biosynthesis